MKHSLSATNHFLVFSQKTILLFIFFLLFSNSAFSQGYSSYIKKAALVGENPSIIKEASLGKYLILHKSHFSSFCPEFEEIDSK